MRIGILGGTGRMGSRLARGYMQAGHEVIIGSRRPAKAEGIAKQIGSTVRGGSLQSAAQDAEIIVLAVGFRDAAATVAAVRDALIGKIVVDITNPFGAVPPGATSGIEENRKSAPKARWVAAYKTTFWKTLQQPAMVGGKNEMCWFAATMPAGSEASSNSSKKPVFEPWIVAGWKMRGLWI